MATFKVRDRVLVRLVGADGQDVEARGTVTQVGKSGRAYVKFDGDGSWLCWNMSPADDRIRPLPMTEPTEFGAMVDTDEGLAVRLSGHTDALAAWCMDDGGHPSFYAKVARWSELKNPRAVTR